MKKQLKPGDIDFEFVDRLNRQARRRRILWSGLDLAAPLIVVLAAMAVGWMLCAAWMQS